MSRSVRIMPEPPPEEIEVITVTPAMADAWLGRNRHNRNIRQRKVEMFARDMTEGRWQFNGDTIRFALDGTLLDGQHRLLAIIASGVSVRVVVIRGLPFGAQETMDSGSARTAGDALRLRGNTEYSTVAAVARKVAFWQHGERWTYSNYVPSTTELLNLIDADQTIQEAAAVASTYNSRILAPTSIVGLCWWLFVHLNRAQADDFFERLATGADLAPRHPILMLRNRLIDLRARPGQTLGPERYAALIIRTWNAYREGRSLGSLLINTGKPDEKFPEPK